MDKKIVSIIFLSIIFISIAVTYVYLDQPEDDKKQDIIISGTPTDDEVNNEIDDLFLDEDGEIDIGDML